MWTSDGTAAGTHALTNVDASGENAVEVLGAFDGHVLFSAADSAHGTELWSSDGTVAGTALVKDIRPGTDGSGVSSAAVAGHRLFFVADDGTHGRELWVSDGTTAGTTLTADLNAGASDTNIYELTAVGDDVYFNASLNTAVQAGEPYKSDGTPGGTGLVKDIETQNWYTSNSNSFTAFNGAVYFSAMTQAGGQELYVTDGTAPGTSVAAEIRPGAAGGEVADLVVAGGKLYFTASDGTHGKELWAYDGSTATMVKDINSSGGSEPYFLTAAAGGTLDFIADDGAHGAEPWTTDGTAAGTRMMAEIRPGATGSAGFQPIFDGTLLWLQADDGVHGSQPWTTDGTQAGTTSHPLGTRGRAELGAAARAGDRLVTVLEGSPVTLLSTDGTSGGTKALSPTLNAVTDLVSLGDKAYFRGRTSAAGDELWVTDGTDAGTHIVTDLEPGSNDGVEDGPFVAGGKLLLTSRAGTSSNSTQLWTSDGTAAGTTAVTDDTQLEWVSKVTPFGSGVAFSAADPNGDYQAWVSDGTAAGTRALTVAGLSGGTNPSDFGVLDGKLYFGGYGLSVDELYVSDGTAAGTHAVGSGLGDPAPHDFVATGGKLYYIADQSPEGRQLHVTDGTAAGTHLVKAIGPGQYYQGPKDLTAIGGTLAFTAGGAPGVWITDGTTAGTAQLASAAAASPALRRVGDRVYFTGFDVAHGTELWATDGTADGTALAADLVAGAGSSHPRVLGDVAGKAIVAGDDPVTGSVLYGVDAWPVAPVTPPPPSDGGGTTPTVKTPVPPAATPAPAPVKAPVVGRAKPSALTLAIAAKADRKPPFRYAATGRLVVPKNVAKAKACTGTVTLTARRGDTVVARATATLTKSCTYSVVVTKATYKRLAARGGTLTVTARFSGNTVLLPARSAQSTVRYGGR